jgi:hypothetical protein
MEEYAFAATLFGAIGVDGGKSEEERARERGGGKKIIAKTRRDPSDGERGQELMLTAAWSTCTPSHADTQHSGLRRIIRPLGHKPHAKCVSIGANRPWTRHRHRNALCAFLPIGHAHHVWRRCAAPRLASPRP